MKIDQLPVEMLVNIFSYLPAYDQVLLVNQMFNNIACMVNGSICLRIDWNFLERFLCNNGTRSQWHQSIKTANRAISTVEIVGEDDPFLIRNHHQIVPVFERFSASITSLKIASLTTDVSTIGKILSFTPNIERLDLDEVKCYAEDEPSHNDHSKDDYNVTKLKFLRIHRCDEKFNAVASWVPVGFLTELQMCCDWNSVTAVLIRQLNIKTLVLKSMYLRYGTDFNEQIMTVVTNLLELEELAIDITNIPVHSIQKIGNLKKLQNLLLQNDSNDTYKLQTLTGLNNPSIKKMSLCYQGNMPLNLINSLAKSAPYFNHFNVIKSWFISARNGSNPDPELDAIMHNFNYVEVLSIAIIGDPFVNAGNYFNPKLRELSIYLNYLSLFHEWLPQLIAAYPNLKKLKLRFFLWSTNYTDPKTEIKPILNGFTKLESLILTSAYASGNCDDLDCLHDHKGKLKLVSLGRLRKNVSTDEAIKKLREDFAVVNLNRDRVLTVAADRYTMVRERRTDSFYEM